MAKKNRDLFEILGSRSGGSTGIVQRVQDMVAPSSGRSKKGKKKGGRAAAPAISGVVLAAVGFGCLVTGFAVGRWTDSSGGTEDLNVAHREAESAGRPNESRFGVEPGRFGAAEAMSDEKLTESLSQFYYVLLPFSVPDGPDGDRTAFEKARRLAEWAHGKGFENVRLRPFATAKRQYWIVVSYVEDPNDTSELKRLSELESPAFAPGLSAYVANKSKIYKSS